MKRTFPRKSVGLFTALFLLVAGISATVAVPKTYATVGSNNNLSVFIGYAEDKETNNPNPANFPIPWAGAPNTTFLGNPVPGQTACGSLSLCYDTGAIRLDNSGTTDIAVSNVTVAIHPHTNGGKTFSLWGSFTVPAGKSVILAANPPANDPGYDNFDTSGYPSNNCTPITDQNTVAITIAGVTTTLYDSTHVLDTGGIDEGFCKGNESIQWRAIGAAGIDGATLSLNPTNAHMAVGQSITETALLQDGGGSPIPNAAVNFSVTNGPDAGQSGSALTDSTGHASFTYTNSATGIDIVQASVTTVGTFSTGTSVTWGTPPPPTWTGQDIGNPPLAGSDSVSNGTWTISGEGTNIGGSADQFHFVSQPLYTDGGIQAQVLSMTNTNSRAQAGIMLRQTTNPSSPFYALLVTPQRGIYVFDRAGQGANVSTVASLPSTTSATPVYIQVQRSGTTFTAYTSSDGTNWTLIPGSSITLSSLNGSLLVGMAVSSRTSNTPKPCIATFNSVSIL